MSTCLDRLQQFYGQTWETNPDPAAIEAAFIPLLPDLNTLSFSDQATLLQGVAEAIATNPDRLHEAAELAEEAWLLAREDDEIVLAVQAKCANIRFTACNHDTFESYLGSLNKLGFHFLRRFSRLSIDELNEIDAALQKVYAYGSSLVQQGVLR